MSSNNEVVPREIRVCSFPVGNTIQATHITYSSIFRLAMVFSGYKGVVCVCVTENRQVKCIGESCPERVAIRRPPKTGWKNCNGSAPVIGPAQKT